MLLVTFSYKYLLSYSVKSVTLFILKKLYGRWLSALVLHFMVLMVYCSLLFSSVSYFNLLVPAFPQDLGLIFPVSQSWGFLFLVRQWQLRDPHSPQSVQDWAALLCGWALTVVTAEA